MTIKIIIHNSVSYIFFLYVSMHDCNNQSCEIRYKAK